MSKVLDIKSPNYFHRDYKNDLAECEDKNSVLNQMQRVGLVALPFISLYKPFGKTLAIGTSAARVLSCSVELISAIKEADAYKLSKSIANTALAISSIAGTILLHPIGMLITTGHDLTLNGHRLIQAIVSGKNDKAIQEIIQLANNIFYLLTMTHGGLEYQILSLACQVILGSHSSIKELKEGNYLEFAGHALMTAIRVNQTIPQIQALQKKWEIDAIIKKIQRQESVAFNKNVPALCTVGVSTLPVVSTLVSTNKPNLISAKKDGSINSELSQALVKYGNNEYGIPALHAAIRANDLKAVELFLDNGASPNSRSRKIPDLSSYTSFDYPDSALDFAAAFGNESLINLLIKRGAQVNPKPIIWGKDQNDAWIPNSPLQYAARFNNVKGAEALLKHRANPYYYIYEGTAIHIAARYGSVEVLRLFKNWNIDLNYNAKDAYIGSLWWVSSPLNYAVYSDIPGSVNGIKALLELGVKIESDYKGAYPLWVCAKSFPLKGSSEKLKLLLEYGANPNYKYINGESLLHEVITYYECVKILIENNCDINIKNNDGYTPLRKIRDYLGGDIEKIKQLLISVGAKE